MKAIFKTLDGLRSVITTCPYIEDESTPIIMRPIREVGKFGEYRKYERTTENYLGVPIFKEAKEGK